MLSGPKTPPSAPRGLSWGWGSWTPQGHGEVTAAAREGGGGDGGRVWRAQDHGAGSQLLEAWALGQDGACRQGWGWGLRESLGVRVAGVVRYGRGQGGRRWGTGSAWKGRCGS